MVPIAVLQSLRRLGLGRWATISISVMMTLMILVAALLSILFPAVQLPPIKGEYNVGIVKFHIPVNFATIYEENSHVVPDGFVSVRILYPTLEEPKNLPYLDTSTALDYCKETMAFGAPPLLKDFHFMLHNWRLIQMAMSPNAKPCGTNLPLIVYSHGLGGTSITYTYQTQHLAAQGHVVMVLDHTDGSAPVVETHDGSRHSYNSQLLQMWKDGKEVEYVQERRARTDHRVKEFIAAAISLLNLNELNIPQLSSVGVSFVNKLNKCDLHFMGNTFGAATALTAASRRPDLASSVIAHEPVVDWMPDDAQRALFAEHKLEGGPLLTGGTGGYETQDVKDEKKGAPNGTCQLFNALHDIPTLFLYSDKFKQRKWGGSELIEYMHERGELGHKNGVSHFGVIQDEHHAEFSDTCLLTPIWLARSVGVTGTRNPRETAEEIKERTVTFITAVRS